MKPFLTSAFIATSRYVLQRLTLRVFLFLDFFLIIFFIAGCKKNERICFDDVPISPYSSPVWHPNGEIIGFNRLPIKTVAKDEGICSGYAYTYYGDSTGFWLINRDGSQLRRVTDFQLLTPSWSPDGKWIAFANGGTIYKMAFDGTSFDTSHIIALTNNGANNFFPSWNPSGDTIYYDSNKSAPSGTSFYAIWKMAADGNGQTLITSDLIQGGREPFCVNDSQILFMRYSGQFNQVFSMNSNGNNIIQITTDTFSYNQKEYPKFFNSKIYYESVGIYSVNPDGSDAIKLCSASTQNFSISKDGTIAYVNFDYSKIDRTFGTLWLMDITGNNKRQITFNNY